MTNYEKLKSTELDELGHYLCYSLPEDSCDDIKCPVYHLCSEGKNGFTEWLKMEEQKW